MVVNKDIIASCYLNHCYQCFSFADGNMFPLILGVFAP